MGENLRVCYDIYQEHDDIVISESAAKVLFGDLPTVGVITIRDVKERINAMEGKKITGPYGNKDVVLKEATIN